MSSTELLASLVLGLLGLLAAWIERRDGWRLGALAERHDREMADLRERVARLEERGRPSEAGPAPCRICGGSGRTRDEQGVEDYCPEGCAARRGG